MNNLLIPPSPNWYESRILACTIDNTIIYGARNDIVIIKPKDREEPAYIKIIQYAHSERITSIDCNKNWGPTDMWAVSASEDRVIKLWNMQDFTCKYINKAHTTKVDKLVGAAFAGNNKVVSVSENGFITLWHTATDEVVPLRNVFLFKVSITTLSACPHSPWLVAFGMKCGLVVVTDLRKTGKVLYKMRGHDKSVISLAWCPVPYNIFPKDLPKQKAKAKRIKKNKDSSVSDYLKQCEALKETLLLAATSSNDLEAYIDIDKNCANDENNVINLNEETKINGTTSSEIRYNLEQRMVIEGAQNITEVLEVSHNATSEDLVKDTSNEKKTSDVDNLLNHEKTEIISSTAPSEDLVKDTSNEKKTSDVDNLLNHEKTEIISSTAPSEDLVKDTSNEKKTSDVDNLLNHEKTEIISSTAPSEDLVTHTSNDKKTSDVDNLLNDHQKTEIIPNVCESNEIEILETNDDVILETTPIVIDEEAKESSIELDLKEINDENVEIGKLRISPMPRLSDDKSQFTDDTKEYLLASSSKGGLICIWRAATDGNKQMEILITQNKNRRNYRSSDKAWITLCWSDPTKLLSSSAIGELLQWDLLIYNKNSNSLQKRLVHHDHGSNLFSIAVPRSNYNTWEEDNWRTKNDQPFVWTVGQERYLLCTSLTAQRETFASYPTIGGYVYCLTSSHLDPTRLAVGIGDNTAKIWDLSRPHTQHVVMTNLWQKIQSKVLTLAWHPRKENILAYGTIEGRIGLINTNNTSKPPSLLTQHFRTSVHKIVWGPLNGGELLALYAVGEGKLAIYNSEKPLTDPKIIDIPKEYITTMAWKLDYTMLTVGMKSGAIYVYDKHFTLLTIIYAQHKNILTIAWHPEATGEDHEYSPYNSWFAVSTTDASVIVYDIAKERIIGDGNEDTDNRVVAVLNGHSQPVRSLCWSYFENAKLVSGGGEGVAQVWDVRTKEIVSTFTGHNLEAILTILWSPLDKNYIISGGKDNCLRIWNTLENKPMSDSELAKVRKECSKLKQDNRKQKESIEDDGKTSVKRNNMLTLTATIQNNVQSSLDDCKKVFFRSLNREGAEVNGVSDGVKQIEKEFDATKLFGDKNDILELLEFEEDNHVEKKKIICNQHISLWKGDIAETVRNAIKYGTLTPWLISVAPMVSPKLWSDACEAYAAKLLDNSNSDPIEIVSYLLACHKIQEAVDVLCTATLFREALVLAKCRLSQNDFVIKDIMYKWSSFAISSGLFELAAQCFIQLGEYEEAAKALFKRSDPDTLEFAIKLAEKSDNQDLIDAVTLRYNMFKKTDLQDEIEENNKLKDIEINKGNGNVSEETVTDTDTEEEEEEKSEEDKPDILTVIEEFRKTNNTKKKCTVDDVYSEKTEDEEDEFIDIEN